ncbi:MAG TPA: hypothetical protein ENH26_02015 [Candidatus Wolfebacteria bacterium]|nr:hypothetical protein [Candidatus Wolfebacteria bacterium]
MKSLTLEKFLQKIKELPRELNPIPILCEEFELLRDNIVSPKEVVERIMEQLFRGEGNGQN